MPQSLLSSAQVSFLNQHPPVLQGKVINSELQQLQNEHIHFFHSDYVSAIPADRWGEGAIPKYPSSTYCKLTEPDCQRPELPKSHQRSSWHLNEDEQSGIIL